MLRDKACRKLDLHVLGGIAPIGAYVHLAAEVVKLAVEGWPTEPLLCNTGQPREIVDLNSSCTRAGRQDVHSHASADEFIL